mmetsp:Transcript_65248/g.123581  ORF Transcript_65248/g.123581 Transcript_65248/m.123581 type:complete len:1044 (+) Transcript_65248:93-3224(+)
MTCQNLKLKEDYDQASQQYLLLRHYARETFQSFLSNLNSDSLRWLEQQFEHHDGELNISTFLDICPTVFPKPRYPEFPNPEEQDFIVQLAGKMLFEDIDVDQSGGADWMEFVEFVCAISECLRIAAEQGSSTQFEFHKVEEVQAPYRPTITKCHFDKLFFWPAHPAESIVVFEEGQSGFHLHRPTTMQRKRRVDGHRSDLLDATFLPDPFEWTVTSGNDKMLCFWDAGWNSVKKWSLKGDPKKGELDAVAGALCWCDEIKALYFTDHRDQFSDKLQAWRIRDFMAVRESEKPFKPERALEFSTGHTKSVQCMTWMGPLQCLATASLDKSIRIFDLVQMERTQVLEGHSKGLTCLEYAPSHQILLSGGFDNIISMWDPGAGIRFHTLHGHECSVTGICAVPDTEHEILSVDLNSVVKLWDVRRLACVQSFNATDQQAERAGELEPLEPRALCPLSRDRLLISGRRMEIFERDASQPQLSADSSIMAMVFSSRKLEIATSVKNYVRIWCALTGKLLTVHNNVIEGNITAMSLGLGERRCFIGSDTGEINVINFACGAPLKSLIPHEHEVTEIQCIPGKVLTLSTADKKIKVHDDTNPQKATVLKVIDVSSAGAVVRFSHDHEKLLVGCSEEGIFWFAMDFAKQVSNSTRAIVQHTARDGSREPDGSLAKAPASCVRYFETAPLIVSSDSEACIIFWSISPLLPFEFFTKMELALTSTKQSPVPVAVGITSFALSWPDEDLLIVGTEHGTVACINIQPIVQKAKSLAKEIIYRKEHGEAADVISGRIFDKLAKPKNSPEYVYPMPNKWIVERAHRGSVEQIIFCKHRPPIVLTLGFDVRVCIWSPETGEALGTLEQGLAEGLAYERLTKWRFPIDARAQVAEDLEALAKAAVPSEEGSEEDAGSVRSAEKPPDAGSAAGRSRSNSRAGSAKSGKSGGSQAGRGMTRSQSSPGGLAMKSGKRLPKKYDFSSKATTKVYNVKGRPKGVDWLAGPLAPTYVDFCGSQLPALQSGLRRQKNAKEGAEVVKAARRLSAALNTVPSSMDLRL